jgi:predicted Ser/Thr protein kinase
VPSAAGAAEAEAGRQPGSDAPLASRCDDPVHLGGALRARSRAPGLREAAKIRRRSELLRTTIAGMAGTEDSTPTVGRYEIVRELGKGAMGVVYLARDPRVDRLVAIKMLQPAGGLTPAQLHELQQRFLNEAKAAGRLDHPNVVSVLDADEAPGEGNAYLVMTYVDGREFRDLLDERLSHARLLEILADVAAGLDHAHARGVIHRDVKPANVLVETKSGRAMLTDFGVARLGDSTVTQAGQLLGSPAYMAPEQIRGIAVTPATDIYALGVMTYEAFAGRRPFQGQDLVSTTHAILNEQPEALSRLVTQLPQAVDAVLLEALAKDPARRPESARHFIAALAGASRDEEAETLAVSGRLPASAPDPSRRRPAWQWGLAALAVVLLALVGWRVAARDPADAAAADSSGDEPTAAGAPEAAGTGEAAPDPVPALPGTVRIDLYTVRSGTLIVRSNEEEVGRSSVAAMKKGKFRLKNPKRHAVLTVEIPAGEQSLELIFVVEDGRTLRRTLNLDIEPESASRLTIDVGTLGREMDVR